MILRAATKRWLAALPMKYIEFRPAHGTLRAPRIAITTFTRSLESCCPRDCAWIGQSGNYSGPKVLGPTTTRRGASDWATSPSRRILQMLDRPARGSEGTGKQCRFCTLVDPVLQRPAGSRGIILAAAGRFDGFFELSHRLPLVFLPVRYIDPLFL